MIKPINFLLLASSLFFTGCGCDNSDIENGPRDGEPKFSLSLANGVKREDLCTNRPIPLVLKDENFSKHDVSEGYGSIENRYEIFSVQDEKGKGKLHFMDAQGKAGKWVGYKDSIELKDGILPLLFVPNGKSGKDTASLKFVSSTNGASFEVSIDLDLKEQKPKFSLALADGVKKEDVSVNRPIPLILKLILKDENFSKHDTTTYTYKRPYQKLEKGVIHFMDSNGKAGKELKHMDKIELKDGVFPLLFVPNGKLGKETVALKLTHSGKGDSFEVSIELDLKNPISLEVPEKIETSKLTTAYLKINGDPNEEYTLKSVRIDHFPVEMTYDNGEGEGTWAEIKPVRIGDKFKGGEDELSIKLYGIHDKIEAGAYQPDTSKVIRGEEVTNWKGEFEYWLTPVDLDLVLVDSKGNEYETKSTFKVRDISFDFEITDVEWVISLMQHPNQADFAKSGIFYFKMKFKEKEGGGGTNVNNRLFKILSFKADDGSAVSLMDGRDPYSGWHNGVGETFCTGYATEHKDLWFRFDQMTINALGNSTTLALKVEGPGGIVKTAKLEVTPGHKELILLRKIEWVDHKAMSICNNWKWERDDEYKAKRWCEGAIAFLGELKLITSQVENPLILAKSVSPNAIKEIESALKQVESLKECIELTNKRFNFNFVSPI